MKCNRDPRESKRFVGGMGYEEGGWILNRELRFGAGRGALRPTSEGYLGSELDQEWCYGEGIAFVSL